MSKFLNLLEKYTKNLGLAEAVPGSTNVMTPATTGTPGGQPNAGVDNLTVDEIAKQEQDHIKTTQDVMDRIAKKVATPEDYAALNAASAGLDGIQKAKAKLAPQGNQPAAGNTAVAGKTNSLSKPLV